MIKTMDDIFTNERTCYHFSTKAVGDKLLREMYDLMKLGPTSANSCPLRILFVRSAKEKAKLVSCVMPGNVEKVIAAPVTAIFSYDMKFYDNLPHLFPHMPSMKDYFSGSDVVATHTATLNSALQAAYFMMIARSRGLAITPMSGFDMDAVDKNFLVGTYHKSSFLCCLGYRSEDEIHPRAPRLSFEEACKVI